METVTTEIIGIYAIKEERSKTGRLYHAVSTNKGIMNVFEDSIAQSLQSYIGKNVSCEIATSDKGFKNIRKINVNPDISKGSEIKPEFKYPKELDKTATMYVSYAKDIFIARSNLIKTEYDPVILMDEAINLVKQAREAF